MVKARACADMILASAIKALFLTLFLIALPVLAIIVAIAALAERKSE